MTNADAMRLEIAQIRKRRPLYSMAVLGILIAVIVAGYGQANAMNSGGFLSGLDQFFDYPGEIVIEAWQAGPAFFGLLWRFLPALIETLNIAAVATILGGLAGMLFAFLGSGNLNVWPPLVPVARRTMDVMRAFPELILALFLIFVLGTSPVPAMIAVAFHTAGALGKQFSEVNENIDMKALEGLGAVGATWFQRMKFAVLPQVLPNYLSYFMLRFEINVRASAILGFVGAGGIGTELRRTIGWGQGSGDETAALFLLLILAIFLIDQASSWMRQRITRAEKLA
ncbi:phosphonate ABC transporter, permease protein PhnE [Minwuia sp.]|uniref:phosphonate ABC transporter, permease protein PhnE n=1 Tax=Minwuia sp. TaxID=2493630 RepID=UPI003A8E6494